VTGEEEDLEVIDSETGASMTAVEAGTVSMTGEGAETGLRAGAAEITMKEEASVTTEENTMMTSVGERTDLMMMVMEEEAVVVETLRGEVEAVTTTEVTMVVETETGTHKEVTMTGQEAPSREDTAEEESHLLQCAGGTCHPNPWEVVETDLPT